MWRAAAAAAATAGRRRHLVTVVGCSCSSSSLSSSSLRLLPHLSSTDSSTSPPWWTPPVGWHSLAANEQKDREKADADKETQHAYGLRNVYSTLPEPHSRPGGVFNRRLSAGAAPVGGVGRLLPQQQQQQQHFSAGPQARGMSMFLRWKRRWEEVAAGEPLIHVM
eukprot:jgi/Chlat1/3836/Chrsp26S08840